MADAKTAPPWVWLASLAILAALIYALWPKPNSESSDGGETGSSGGAGALAGMRQRRRQESAPPLIKPPPVNQKRATDWHHAQHQTLTPAQAAQRLRVPPEPHGYITDTEITSVSQPVDWRVWKNWDNFYERESMNPNTYGSFFFPSKTGYYTNNFIW